MNIEAVYVPIEGIHDMRTYKVRLGIRNIHADNHNGTNEIVKFYQDTAQIVLPDNHLDKFQRVLEELVRDYPKYDRR